MSQAEPSSATRNLVINIRAGQRQRELIDRAARLLGKSRSDFMLETACREATDVLLDRRHLQLDPGAWERFDALLDRPPPPTDELRQFLRRAAPWE